MSARRAVPARRGQPLVMLAAVLGLWSAARAVMWEGSDADAFAVPVPLAQAPTRGPAPDVDSHAAGTAKRNADAPAQPLPAWTDTPPRAALAPSASAEPRAVLVVPITGPGRVFVRPAPLLTPSPAAPFISGRIAAGHQLMWLAALSALPLSGTLGRPGAFAPAPLPPQRRVPSTPRWSGDGWLLLRQGAGGAASAAAGALLPSYGASQIGAVIRYRLASSARAPALYLRATSAIANPRDPRLAVGIALRPLAKLPLVAMAEVRADLSGKNGLHPALAAVTALPPIALPLAARAELYAQAGYVAGGPDATAFVDGQLRVDRAIARIGSAELRAGAGIWGGAQKSAGRLDIGPGATLRLAHVAGGARLALDWRLRIAGDAAPRSGPALTLSAGF